MSHFSVLVIGEDIAGQLVPYDEALAVPRYCKATKVQLIQQQRDEIAEYRDSTYADYLRDPAAYCARFADNPEHLAYLRDEFPPKLAWTDAQCYQAAVEWEEPENIGADGEVYSTYNPQSRWDWYVIGGRFADYFALCPADENHPEIYSRTNQALKGEVDWERMVTEKRHRAAERWQQWLDYARNVTHWSQDVQRQHAYWKFDIWRNDSEETYMRRQSSLATFAIVAHGQWHARAQMGWWGVTTDQQPLEEWEAFWWAQIKAAAPETLLTLLDAHI